MRLLTSFLPTLGAPTQFGALLLASLALALPVAASPAFQEVDTDGDGLSDVLEAAFGTDPFLVDSDFDGAWDGTEVDLADGSGSPDPLNPDSDGDSLFDGAEIQDGTSPSLADTDGDGFWDDFDAYPLTPAFSSGSIEDVTRIVGELIQLTELSEFEGSRDRAKRARRNNLARRATRAANAIANNQYELALVHLWRLYNKVDGQGPICDWMITGQSSVQILDDVSLLIFLLDGGNPCTPDEQFICEVQGLESCAPGSSECGPPLELCTPEVEQSCIDAGLTPCTIGSGSADCGPVGLCTEYQLNTCRTDGYADCNLDGGLPTCSILVTCTTEQMAFCSSQPSTTGLRSCGGTGGQFDPEDGACTIGDPCTSARAEYCEDEGYDPCEPGSWDCVE